MTSPTKFYHVTNYMVDVIMWPKFRFGQKKPHILTGGLGWSSIIWERQYLWPWDLQQCGKGVKIKSNTVLEANSNVCGSYMEKLVGQGGRELVAPKILNSVKWIKMGGFFFRFYKKTTPSINCRRQPFNYLYLNYAWQINELNYPFELGMLISLALHFQEYSTPQII